MKISNSVLQIALQFDEKFLKKLLFCEFVIFIQILFGHPVQINHETRYRSFVHLCLNKEFFFSGPGSVPSSQQ